jgi:K+-sensing histidine kinase KdpD
VTHRMAIPWFRAHRLVAAEVILATSIAVFVLQMLDGHASDAVALLYVLPISLAATAFGLAGGLAGASAAYMAFAFVTFGSSTAQVGLDGWISRGAAMFLLGGLLGRATDQSRRADRLALEHQRSRLVTEERNRRLGEAIELSDSILQQIAAAKWMIEQGDSTRAVGLLASALRSGQQMVGELLPPRVTAPTAAPRAQVSATS